MECSYIVEQLLGEERKARNLIKENAVNGSLLRQAAEEGNLNVVKFFLTAKDRFMLSRRAKKRCTNEGAADVGGNSPLHLAASNGHFTIVHTLLSPGAKCDVQNKKKETPLYMAAREGHKSIVNFLVSRGADAYHCTLNEEKSPVDIAAFKGHWVIVECFLNSKPTFPSSLNIRKLIIEGGVDPNTVDIWGLTLLHKAVDVHDVELVHYLLQSKVLPDARSKSFGLTPLHVSCLRGRNDIARLLIQHGASVNTGKRGETPLYFSVCGNYFEVAKTLLENDADVNIKYADHDETVLHLAVRKGGVEVVRLLLDWGADVNAKDKDGYTPLHGAALADDVSMLQLLLERGANVNAMNMQRNTPFYYASDGETKELLLQNGADATLCYGDDLMLL